MQESRFITNSATHSNHTIQSSIQYLSMQFRLIKTDSKWFEQKLANSPYLWNFR